METRLTATQLAVLAEAVKEWGALRAQTSHARHRIDEWAAAMEKCEGAVRALGHRIDTSSGNLILNVVLTDEDMVRPVVPTQRMAHEERIPGFILHMIRRGTSLFMCGRESDGDWSPGAQHCLKAEDVTCGACKDAIRAEAAK